MFLIFQCLKMYFWIYQLISSFSNVESKLEIASCLFILFFKSEGPLGQEQSPYSVEERTLLLVSVSTKILHPSWRLSAWKVSRPAKSKIRSYKTEDLGKNILKHIHFEKAPTSKTYLLLLVSFLQSHLLQVNSGNIHVKLWSVKEDSPTILYYVNYMSV